MDVKDSTRDDYLHLGLAPSYGTLTSESVKAMDEQLKVMIAGTMRTLKALPADQRSWENVLSKMMQNPLLQAEEAGKEVARTDRIIKHGTNVFKFDGSPDAAIVKEVRAASVVMRCRDADRLLYYRVP